MKFGLDVAQHQLTWDELVDRVRFAEEAGFDGAWVFDHFKALYGDPSGPCLEGWSLLAALAAVTERIRLGTLVTGMTYRHPSILTTQAVTVDHISKGRLELGVGAAWFEREHHELGVPFPSNGERARRLEDGVQVMKLLMTTDDANFEGRYVTLAGASYNPKPVQRPHPPIWIGASGPRLTLPIVGRHADVWHTFGNAASIARQAEVVDRAAEEVGRDPRSIRRSTDLSLSQDWDAVRTDIEALERASVTYLTVGWPSEGKERLNEFVSSVMPSYT
jgi:F420-dependent oxidoreductase-like protein